MANDCLAQVQACAMRVTKLDGSGVPQPGASNLYVTDKFQQVQYSPQYEAGDEIKEKNACGAICINFKSAPSFLRVDLQITLCTPDPQLMEMLLGGTVLTSGARVGFAVPPIGVVPDSVGINGVSVELWAKRITSGGVQDPTNPYGWWVFPKVLNTQLGQANIENGPHLPVITGEAYENTNWFNGPANDWPLTSASNRAAQWIPWNTKPASSCGYQSVAAT